MPDQVTPSAVRDAIDAVLGSESTERAGARRLADEIAAMPPAAEVAEALVAVIATRV
jgi:hypothetical protein